MTFQSLPGFRDFYPAEFTARHHLVSAWRETSRRYGFEEYDGPPLEPLELYVEKSGDEIVEQLYNFVDKGGRAVALRPEMTPTLARMVGARARSLPKPIRWFSVPQLFRYERTQRGRLREHFQWNVDVVGEADISADAEVLAVALDSLAALGLNSADVVARVNDRRLLERLLTTTVGVTPERLGAAYAAIDKLGREGADRTRERLVESSGLDRGGADLVLDLLALGLDDLSTEYGAHELVGPEIERLWHYFGLLSDLGWAEHVTFDPTIVRGLAYYTGTVFEIFDRAGELRAICGGGRYDNLLAAVSDIELPAVGFGMGDVVLGELLRDRSLLPTSAPGPDYFVVTITAEERPLMRRVARSLRARGHSVSYALRQVGVGKQFKEANNRGARRVIVLGPDEVARGVAVERLMTTGEERQVPLTELES